MSRTNIARYSGDQFQARMFWLNAVNLLKSRDPIVEVAWEAGPKGVDDIRVHYQPPIRSTNGPVTRDYIQCKWHVGAGEFGYQDLTDPKFTYGQSYSWLQRAYDAFQTEGSQNRFTFQTNWRIAATNPLFDLVRRENNEIDLSKLFGTKTAKSKMGRVRECWCEHLEIDEDILQDFAASLTFADDVRSMSELRERLDDRFASVGMKAVPLDQSSYVYDDLIMKLHKEGDVVMDDTELRAVCDRESLWDDAAPNEEPYTLGIRSFKHKYDPMDHRCHQLLDLVPKFDGWFLKARCDWQSDIAAQLAEFVERFAPGHGAIRLRIDAHASIALAAGRLLDVKSGMQLGIEQRTSGLGLRYWSSTDGDSSGPDLRVDTSGGANSNRVVALGITHDVLPGVKAYCEERFPDGYQLISARLDAAASGIGVNSGAHAWRIVESLAATLRGLATTPDNHVHLFAAAPNGAMFFLGQQLGIGKITVYEWDFERRRGGGYYPGLTVH